MALHVRTIYQEHDARGIVKAGELIESRGTGELTLHDRRVLNLLHRFAGQKLCDDVEHIAKIAELRGPHKGGERVKDSVMRLMRTIVAVPTKGRDGKAATSYVPILSDTTVSDDDDDPSGEVVYSFSPRMREIISGSTHWGRVRAEVMFAFSSKYALALYELISLRINLDHMWQETFALADFRALLGVPDGKLDRTPNLLKWAVQPAEGEVNALADFGVKIEPIRRGGPARGEVTGFRLSWWKKDVPELKKAYAELSRPRIGRSARIAGAVSRVKA